VTWQAHLLASLVALTSLFVIARSLRRRQLKASYAVLWLSLGTGMVLLAAFPRILDWVSLRLGITYGPTTLFLFAISFLVLLAVHYSRELSRLEERTRILAEEVALLRARRTPQDSDR
jgi:hypothetical protein